MIVGGRPAWVPEWIWNQYEDIGRNPGDPLDDMRASLMADEGCAVVWKAMTRRRVQGGELPDFEARVVLLRAPIFASGLSPEDRIPPAKRRRDGKMIAKLSSQLRAMLVETSIELDEWPHPLRSALSLGATPRYFERDAPPWIRELALDPNRALKDLCALLEALRSAAASWETWTAPVKQPNAPDADRLYFIRAMTAAFKSMYGTPLREPVAALTRCLFRCEISATTVAILAP